MPRPCPQHDWPDARFHILHLALTGLGFPLLAEQKALYRAQENERHENENGNGQQHMHPEGRRIGDLNAQDRAHAHHANEEHDEPCGAVAAVGEGVGQAAALAGFGDAQIAIKQFSPPATGAFACKARGERRKIGIIVVIHPANCNYSCRIATPDEAQT